MNIDELISKRISLSFTNTRFSGSLDPIYSLFIKQQQLNENPICYLLFFN